MRELVYDFDCEELMTTDSYQISRGALTMDVTFFLALGDSLPNSSTTLMTEYLSFHDSKIDERTIVDPGEFLALLDEQSCFWYFRMVT